MDANWFGKDGNEKDPQEQVTVLRCGSSVPKMTDEQYLIWNLKGQVSLLSFMYASFICCFFIGHPLLAMNFIPDV